MTAETYGTSSSSTVTNLFLELFGIINLTALRNCANKQAWHYLFKLYHLSIHLISFCDSPSTQLVLYWYISIAKNLAASSKYIILKIWVSRKHLCDISIAT